MLIFVLFVSAEVLFDGGFSLRVSLNWERLQKLIFNRPPKIYFDFFPSNKSWPENPGAYMNLSIYHM